MQDGLTVEQIGQQVKAIQPLFLDAIAQMNQVMVGQKILIERLLLGLVADGHVLVEGLPGLAKTTAVKTLADVVSLSYKRIQFTPDLLPSDIVGTQVYSPKDGSFSIKAGPIFANIVLADEINRAPAKVQSALLEAMQERQVTLGDESRALPSPFLVMATQNPIEQEGTYPLPEAQVDRFMLKVKVTYPSKEEEILIMKRMTQSKLASSRAVITKDKLEEAKAIASKIFVDEKLYDYVANIVFATREPKAYGLDNLKPLIDYGASPRASIFLIRAAKAYALLQGRAYVTPQDIKSIGLDVLRHRIGVSYEADAQRVSSDEIVLKIFDRIDVP